MRAKVKPVRLSDALLWSRCAFHVKLKPVGNTATIIIKKDQRNITESI